MTQLADKTSLGELLGLAYRARVSHVHDRVLLLAMVFHADWNSGRNIYASLTTLAHECALSVSAVQRSLRRLLPDGGLGYVVVQAPPTSRRPVTYRLDIPALERGRSAQPKGPGARGRRLLRMSLAASRPDTLGVSIGPPRVVPQTTQGGLPDHSRVVCGTTDPSLYPSHDPSLARVQITRDRRTNAQTRLQTVAAVQMTKGKERADEGGGCSPSQLERARVLQYLNIGTATAGEMSDLELLARINRAADGDARLAEHWFCLIRRRERVVHSKDLHRLSRGCPS